MQGRKKYFSFEPDSGEACVHFQFQWEIIFFFFKPWHWPTGTCLCSEYVHFPLCEPASTHSKSVLRGTFLLYWLGSLWRDKGHKLLLVLQQRLHFIDGGTLHTCTRDSSRLPALADILVSFTLILIVLPLLVRPKGHALSWIYLQSFCSLNEDKFLLCRQKMF